MYSRTIVKYVAALLAPLLLMGVASATIHVPYQTSVKVWLRDPVSSATSQVGDPVHLIVAADVVIGGYVVFAKGADGFAKVDSVAPGVVHVTFDWVHCVDGSKIGIVGDVTQSEGTNGGNGGGISVGDIQDRLGRFSVAVAGATALPQVQNAVGKVDNTVGSAASTVGSAVGTVGSLTSAVRGLFGGPPVAKAPPTPAPILPLIVVVKNPNGVDITATEMSQDDDTGVK
jgi:hypothetical protein